MKYILAYTAIAATVSLIALQAHAAAKLQDVTLECNANGTVSVEYSIIGAGTGTSADVSLTGDALFGCATRGTNPPGQQQADIDASGTDSANRQGRIEGSLTSSPRPTCRGNQVPFAEYSNLVFEAVLDNGDEVSRNLGSIRCP